MTNSMIRKAPLLSLFLASALSSGAAFADPPPSASAQTARAPDAPRSVYRLDVSITGIEEGARAAAATYVIMVEEHQTGGLSTGANVPLVGSGSSTAPMSPRQDVGLSLRFSYELRGQVLLVTGNVEMSSVEPSSSPAPVSIHHLRAEGVTAVTPGTPTLFTSIYDIQSHRRYEVTINARRVL